MPKPKLPKGAARIKINVTIAAETLAAVDGYARRNATTRSRAIEALVLLGALKKAA